MNKQITLSQAYIEFHQYHTLPLHQTITFEIKQILSNPYSITNSIIYRQPIPHSHQLTIHQTEEGSLQKLYFWLVILVILVTLVLLYCFLFGSRQKNSYTKTAIKDDNELDCNTIDI